jgi:hypothetical protein
MILIDDDTFISDDDMPVEWMAQVFEVATLRSRNEQTAQRQAPSGSAVNFQAT